MSLVTSMKRMVRGAFNAKLDAMIVGVENQSRLIEGKLQNLLTRIDDQSRIFDRRLNTIARRLRELETQCPKSTRFEVKSAPQSIANPLEDTATKHKATAPPRTNDLESFKDVLDDIKPWRGYVPRGFIVDFLGMLTDIEFNAVWFSFPDPNHIEAYDPNFDPDNFGDTFQETIVPRISAAHNTSDAETWFEAVDWVVSAREARGRYVMIALGACYGVQAVGACLALQKVNPMPYKLVAVEPVPANVEWIKQHMSNNGIDPDEQWIVPLAISDKVEPVLFPVGGPGIGTNNAYSSNEREARQQYADEFIARGMGAEALRNLLLNNTTGLMKDLIPGQNFKAEIKLVSSITLNELLGPFDLVDLLESDIQQSEILVFPGHLDVLRRKVRRIHIGTHGEDVHLALHKLFAENGWEIVFSFKPNSKHETSLGSFETNDGVLTVRNPDL